MNQNRFYREVANRTGESIGFIRNRGFSVVIVPQAYRPTCEEVRQNLERSTAVHGPRQSNFVEQPK